MPASVLECSSPGGKRAPGTRTHARHHDDRQGQITFPQPVREHLGVVTAVEDLYRLRQRPGRDAVSLEEMERRMEE